MQEISPPLFGDWLSVVATFVALAATWGAMIAMLKNIQSKQDTTNESVEELLKKQDKILSAIYKNQEHHHNDHKNIEILLEKLVGKMELALDRIRRE